MPFINIEIKARCYNTDKIRNILKNKKADFKGIDHQIDTYFKCNKGRLKLREGNIEKALIQYFRDDKSGPKKSQVTLYKPIENDSLKTALINSIGILTIVDKKREIYFINNVKFHIDEVDKLGNFVEIEAIDSDGNLGEKKLNEQCEFYIKMFDIKPSNLLEISYSDMLLNMDS